MRWGNLTYPIFPYCYAAYPPVNHGISRVLMDTEWTRNASHLRGWTANERALHQPRTWPPQHSPPPVRGLLLTPDPAPMPPYPPQGSLS